MWVYSPSLLLFITRWCFSTYTGTEGYHTLSISDHNEEDQDLYPVEFNFDHLCWVEICWNQEGHWEAFRAAGTDLGCDIPILETRLGEYREEEHQLTPQTEVQSEWENSEPEEINILTVVNQSEEESLAHLVASIPLPSCETMTTQTISSTIGWIHVQAFLSGGDGGGPGPSSRGSNCPLWGQQPRCYVPLYLYVFGFRFALTRHPVSLSWD